jgi:hypothetical protein
MKTSFLVILFSIVLSALCISAAPNPVSEEKYPDSLPVLSKVSPTFSAIKGSGLSLYSPEVIIYGTQVEPIQVARLKSGCEPRNVVSSGYFKLNSTYQWAIVTVQYPGPGCQWRYTYDNCSSP